jgi:hypothetical protein
MKNIVYQLFAASFLLVITHSSAQVTIGSPNPPDPNATLDIQGTSGGFLMPRLSNAERNALGSVTNGMQIYNTETHCVEVKFPGGWRPLRCDCLTAPANPTNIILQPVYCEGQANVLFVVNQVPDATQYTWLVDGLDTLISGQGTDSIIVNMGSTPGTRSLSIIASNFCGSSNSYSVSYLVQNPSAGFAISPNSPLENNPATFTANQSGLASYQWLFSSGTPSQSQNATEQVTWTTQGSYAVSLQVVDVNGCTDSQNVQVSVINCQPVTYNFSTCGATGRTGPSQGQCDAAYGNGTVSVINGLQFWTVPVSGVYEIEVAGADGSHDGSGFGGGGRGVILKARFSLTQGQPLKMLVGQRGKHGTSAGGGGGGTFVTELNNTPLIIAGGGGSSRSGSILNLPIMDATTNTCGRNGTGGTGGCNGNGATAANARGPGGAGLLTNGPPFGDTRSMCVKLIPQAFVNDGMGGELFYDCGSGEANRVVGGFGGGAGSGWGGAAGGGGYSGGGEGTNSSSGYGGGGGSFVAAQATNLATSDGAYNTSNSFNGQPIQNLSQMNQNAGYIQITRVCN